MATIGIFELLILGVAGLILLAIVGGAIYYIAKKQPLTPGKTTCPHCGSSNPPENKFCGSCGEALA